ncbi:MAG TPA: hypothetical protein DCZ95_05260 [Verrucomicrobia bacterium]|nr:MAG: hypothetical protein A2X46_02905 [Lentisphaerae bacterium GWF2_57_35]HBA83486.1 hypothetical protein [Verrucomicrobiota bacterium]
MDKKFRQWIYLFVLIPFSVFLLAFNCTTWFLWIKNHRASLSGVCDVVKRNIDTLLATETVRLQNIGILPNVDALLTSTERVRRNAMPQRRDQVEAVKERWSSLSRDDFEVREVLDNSVGEMFQRLCGNGAETVNMILTDADGLAVAAASKPDRYSYGENDWWIRAHTRDQTQPVSDGLLPNGVMGLALALRNPQRTNFISGILRAEFSIGEVVSWLHSSPVMDGKLVALISVSNTYSISCKTAETNVDSVLRLVASKPSTEWSWIKGYRYSSQPLDAGIRWTSPVRVVTMRPESYFSLPLLGLMGLTLMLSSLAWIGLKRLVYEVGHKMFFRDQASLVEAGEWIMTRYNKGQETTAGLSAIMNGATSTTEQLNRWEEHLQRVFKGKEALQFAEMHQDLDRSKDFLSAFLDRPYPKIPIPYVEGHLRLDFYHQYKPAFLPGGSFFDIFEAAPDCAGVYMADMAGIGSQRAFLAMILRGLVRNLSKQGRNARFFMSELNKSLVQSLKNTPNPSLTASSVYFVADVTSRIGTFSLAGHYAPFLVRRSSRRIMLLEAPEHAGQPLGSDHNDEYVVGQCRLIDEDFFLFFNEGACKTRDRQGREFGLSRIQDLLNELRHQNKEAIVDGVMRAITDFAGNETLVNDICLAAIDVSSKTEPA